MVSAIHRDFVSARANPSVTDPVMVGVSRSDADATVATLTPL